jgi:very-short-patch-repair endonuclease
MANTKRFEEIKRVYEQKATDIIQQSKKCRWLDPYLMDWSHEFIKSPPEEAVWASIRCHGHIPLYPQFPVLSYFLDFGDPYRQIGVEVDGKAFHDIARDQRRDNKLIEAGWTIYRIPALMTFNRVINDFEDFEDLSENSQKNLLYKWLVEDSDGVIYAIRTLHFGDTPEPEDIENHLGLHEGLGRVFFEYCQLSLEVRRSRVRHG